MKPEGTLLLKRQEVAALLGIDECIAAVEQAFRLQSEGKAPPPGIVGIHAQDGGFHIKAAMLHLSRPYFAAKVNGNFFQNAKRFGMPNILGIIALCDGENGYPLALMDSVEITILRTGAATAVAVKYLARPDSKTITICGCGNQGRVSVRAICRVRPIQTVYAFDADYAVAQRFASELSEELQIEIQAVQSPVLAVRKSDICVTCTPSKQYFLSQEDVLHGTFIAAVGADSAEKQELEPALLASNKVVVDNLEQCATIGELHHALESRLMTRAAVHGELGQVIAGARTGRTSPDDIIIFDSTGTALQDVAAAAIVYERAVSTKSATILDFGG